MTKRRDLFVFVANPDRAEEARDYLSAWLRELDGHPGCLGGFVLKESAGELLDNTVVLALDFESTEAARTLWPKIENTVNPVYPDDKSDKSPDQGSAFYDGTREAVEGVPHCRCGSLGATGSWPACCTSTPSPWTSSPRPDHTTDHERNYLA